MQIEAIFHLVVVCYFEVCPFPLLHSLAWSFFPVAHFIEPSENEIGSYPDLKSGSISYEIDLSTYC